MKRLFIFIAAAALASCSRLGIITDQYWNKAVAGDLNLGRSVKVAEVPVEKKRIPDLSESFPGGMPEKILLSPLYSRQVRKLSRMYPDKHFFYFGYVFKGGENGVSVSNASAVTGLKGILREDRERISAFIESLLGERGENSSGSAVLGKKSGPE